MTIHKCPNCGGEFYGEFSGGPVACPKCGDYFPGRAPQNVTPIKNMRDLPEFAVRYWAVKIGADSFIKERVGPFDNHQSAEVFIRSKVERGEGYLVQEGVERVS